MRSVYSHLQVGLVATVLLIVSVVSFAWSLTIGAIDIDTSDIISTLVLNSTESEYYAVVWQLRFPRSGLAFIAGSGLALSGLMLQAVTRNPLADPYLFGISSGATLGAVCYISFSAIIPGFLAYNIGLSGAAFIGSLSAMTVLLLVCGSTLGRRVETMLLAGVALSFLFSSITSLALYWSDPQAITAVLFWTMGSFARANTSALFLPILFLVVTLVFVSLNSKSIYALMLGDETATTLGINVKQQRLILLILSSLLTASLVAVSGGIGFVGLIIPHIARIFVSQTSSCTPIVVCLFGGTFMLWVDILARQILAQQDLPIGIITGFLGSLFFLALLFTKHRNQRSA